MEYNPNIQLENVIQADPTLKFFLRDATLDFDLLEHQTKIIGSAILIAVNNYLDLKYK